MVCTVHTTMVWYCTDTDKMSVCRYGLLGFMFIKSDSSTLAVNGLQQSFLRINHFFLPYDITYVVVIVSLRTHLSVLFSPFEVDSGINKR
ncbi:hypothetical protein BHE74_00053794 [Ensete ventricosum]|nr:hypothetical protein BHE74_00053794 [Ensete ventricosum]